MKKLRRVNVLKESVNTGYTTLPEVFFTGYFHKWIYDKGLYGIIEDENGIISEIYFKFIQFIKEETV